MANTVFMTNAARSADVRLLYLACFGQVFEAAFMSTTPSGKAEAITGKDEEPKDLEKMSK
jgi:hypothetical protein